MYRDYSIGLAIITYKRPKLFDNAWRSAWDHLRHLVDSWVVIQDGDESSTSVHYQQIRNDIQPTINYIVRDSNGGVARAKNDAFKYLIDRNCHFIFIMEDDMQILSDRAITAYIDASLGSGFEHIMFSQHGDFNLNSEPTSKYDYDVETWPACVGGWNLYTKQSLEAVGLMDERLHNAYEHVEHTARLAHAGFTTPMWFFADVKDSNLYLCAQPDAIKTSAIRAQSNWAKNTEEMMALWKSIDKKTWYD